MSKNKKAEEGMHITLNAKNNIYTMNVAEMIHLYISCDAS